MSLHSTDNPGSSYNVGIVRRGFSKAQFNQTVTCLLYTSDAADD